MEWYCRVDFTSPGQFMLVVAFNFRESESDKKTPGGLIFCVLVSKAWRSIKGCNEELFYPVWLEYSFFVISLPGLEKG